MTIMNPAAEQMIEMAKAYDAAITPSTSYRVGIAVNELTAAIDIEGLDKAEEILAPFSDAVKTEARRIVELMKAEAAK